LVQERGAASVVGVDIGSQFLKPPPQLEVTLAAGDFRNSARFPAK
jgi:hypothetical protein